MNDLSDRTRGDPVNLLSIGRTVMANERTLLAFLRTSLTFLVVGIGFIKYLDHPLLYVGGWSFIVFSGILLIWGVWRYRQAKKVLREVTPEQQQSIEKKMGL